jgi:hypothetical protein
MGKHIEYIKYEEEGGVGVMARMGRQALGPGLWYAFSRFFHQRIESTHVLRADVHLNSEIVRTLTECQSRKVAYITLFRINATRIPASNSNSYNEATCSFIGRNLDRYTVIYLALCVDHELWAPDVSPGVVCTCRGVPRKNPLK